MERAGRGWSLSKALPERLAPSLPLRNSAWIRCQKYVRQGGWCECRKRPVARSAAGSATTGGRHPVQQVPPITREGQNRTVSRTLGGAEPGVSESTSSMWYNWRSAGSDVRAFDSEVRQDRIGKAMTLSISARWTRGGGLGFWLRWIFPNRG